MTTVDRLFEEASKLTHEERAELVDRLCEVDDGWASPEIRDAWLEESKRRMKRLRGGARTYSHEEAMERLRARIERART